MGGQNSTMIYCKNFCKCYNIPLVQQYYKKRRKKKIQTESNNTLKTHTSLLSRFHSSDSRMVQHMQNNELNTTYKQNQDKNHITISIEADKTFQ
jgi:hypothetical protein